MCPVPSAQHTADPREMLVVLTAIEPSFQSFEARSVSDHSADIKWVSDRYQDAMISASVYVGPSILKPREMGGGVYTWSVWAM